MSASILRPFRTEFIALMAKNIRTDEDQEAEIKEAFKVFDRDGNGCGLIMLVPTVATAD